MFIARVTGHVVATAKDKTKPADGSKPEKAAKKPKLNHDFDKFAGTWTAEEADDFDRRVAQFEEIDWEMWK